MEKQNCQESWAQVKDRILTWDQEPVLSGNIEVIKQKK